MDNSDHSKYIYTPNFVIAKPKLGGQSVFKIENLNIQLLIQTVFGLVSIVFCNILFFIYTSSQSLTIGFFRFLSTLQNTISNLINLTNKDFRTLWFLNLKMNNIIRKRKILKFWDQLMFVVRNGYLAILVFSLILILKVISLNTANIKSSESFLNRFIDKYSFVDKKGNSTPLNFATITTSAKKLEDPTRIIKHKTIEGDTINKIADKYGLNPDTVAINTHLLDIEKDKELEKDKDFYLPWQDSYIYLAKDDIEPKKLSEIFKIDENKIYSSNEDVINIETSKFSKGSIVLIPTSNFNEAKKYEELEKIKSGIAVTGDKTNDEKTQKLAENYASEVNGAGKYSGTKSDQKSAGFIWPAAGNLSRCLESGHIACDIANLNMPPVFAAQDGIVKDVYIYTVYGYGKAVVISHVNGVDTLYAHLNEIYVSKGQSVSQGQSIGQMGTTGNSTGIHLHFEVRIGGAKQNPLNYLP
jgi:murein DD-endopeptidase MepM/ murein hydrolase activator NlpD